MKTFLKFTGAIAAVLALISFILLLATPAVTYQNGNTVIILNGAQGIFGEANPSLAQIVFCNGDAVVPAVWSAIIAFILLILAFVVLVLGVILPILKIKALDGVAGLLNLIAVCSLIVVGIFVFIEKAVLLGLLNVNNGANYHLGAGWVIAGILACVAGVIGLIPVCLKLLKK